ncbi:MAG: Cys-Gln thioester bond-forming surface protein [Bacilli bacterium]|nr:Cys-Gln thioester bond-forming surface protein [Bacilli bacterium]
MKKIIIFLITILTLNVINAYHVKAAGSFSFYEGNYIQGIFMTKEKNGIKYYQKARYFMSSNDHMYAYCIEPFAMFNENSTYTRSLSADNLSPNQMKRISLIAYFGYGYGNHNEDKWYAVTQFMIWKEADPSGSMYFTNGLNGNPINAYTNEIQEINHLINNYLTLPSISNYEVNMVQGHSISLTDTNHVLQNYTSNNPNVTISGNKLNIRSLTEGTHIITLTRINKRMNKTSFFYNSSDSQNMATTGDLDNMITTLKVNVKKTKVEVTKVDKDTQDVVSSGEGSLSGAVYQIYDKNMKALEQITIGEDMKAEIENLNFGQYYIQEVKAGVGYKLDENIYEFVIDNDHLNIDLKLENEIIKKKIEINKDYGDGIHTDKESGIHFDIFNHKNELYTTITTNNQGYACVLLPYGRYLIKQRNSTSGYAKNDSFMVEVLDEEPLRYNLYDYKIKVPNTEKNSYHPFIFIIILGGLYAKKKIFC